MYFEFMVILRKCDFWLQNQNGCLLAELWGTTNWLCPAIHELLTFVDSAIVSETENDNGEVIAGIYKPSLDGEAQPITPQSPCYQQVDFSVLSHLLVCDKHECSVWVTS